MAYKPYPRIRRSADGDTPAFDPKCIPGESRAPATATKRLLPGAPGTKRLLERYGDALLCVRYRADPESGRRLTTVELIVEEREGPPAKDAWVRIGYGETELRQRVKDAGGTWDGNRKLWRIKLSRAKALGLQKRVVRDIQ